MGKRCCDTPSADPNPFERRVPAMAFNLASRVAPVSKLLRIASLALTVTALAGGQVQQEPEEDPGLIITAATNLVVVPLHVYQKKKSVNGFGPEAFALRENGVLQNIAFVEGPPGEGEHYTRIFRGDHSPDRSQLQRDAARAPRLSRHSQHMLEGLREDVMISV